MAAKVAENRRTAIVVLGMHRSGTSAMARVISLAGAQLPTNLMVSGPANPDGHWEPQEIADLNDRILAALDSGWSDTFGPRAFRERKPPIKKYLPEAVDIIKRNYGEADFIVLKEPRMSLLLELWKLALEQESFDVNYVIMVRHPTEVANSLKLRDGLDHNKSLMLWTTYMVSAELETRSSKRLFVKFDDLLENPERVLDRIESNLGLTLPRRTWESLLETQDFLKSENKHHTTSKEERTGRDIKPVIDYYEFFEAASKDADLNIDISNETARWLGELDKTVGPLLKRLERDLRLKHAEADLNRRSSDDLNAKIEAERAHFAARESELAGSLDQTRREADETRDQVAKLEAAFDDLNAKLEAERAHFAARESELAGSLDQTRREADESRDQVAKLEAALAASQEEAVRRDAELTRYASAEEAQQSRVSHMTSMLENARAEHARFETELNAQANFLRAELDEATTRISSLTADLASSHAQFSVREAELVEQIARLAAREADLSGQLADAAAKARVAEAAEEYSRRSDELLAEAQALRVLQEEDLNRTRAQLTATEHRLERLVAELDEANTSVSAKDDELDASISQQRELLDAFATLGEQLETLLDGVERELGQTNTTLASANRDHTSRVSRLEAAVGRASNLMAMVATSRRQARAKDDEVLRLRTEIRLAEQRAREIDQAFATARGQTAEREAELRGQLAKAQEEVQANVLQKSELVRALTAAISEKDRQRQWFWPRLRWLR